MAKANAKEAKLDKMGEGFDKNEFASPLYIGPAKGQEGWNPSNPEVDEPHDPLGYMREHE